MGTSSQRASASRPLLVSERGGALVLDDPTRGLVARLFDRLAAEARPGRAPLGRVHGVAVDREGVTVLATPQGARAPRRVRVGASHLAAVRLRISHGEASGAHLAFTVHAERDCVFDCAVSGVEGREAAEALAFRLARAAGLTHYRLRELGEHEIDLELVPGTEGAYRGVAALPIPAPGERLDEVPSAATEAPPRARSSRCASTICRGRAGPSSSSRAGSRACARPSTGRAWRRARASCSASCATREPSPGRSSTRWSSGSSSA
ncbi:MAG: hypothetical protein M5U28_30160 [Sandaracinaceae bacterium]|nr:hypothetical protein [Sandaracinaceae bacterium]